MTRPAFGPDRVDFEALEYTEDDRFRGACFGFVRAGDGWRIEREGRLHLELGEGYRLLRVRSCGVCATDLDRRFLPFPLPQVIGHEVVAEDEHGGRWAIEINASHVARGIGDACPFCAAGLDRHCPDRRVLGIHDLPGGFGPFVLAPEHALVRVPDALPDTTAALVEPFAAALRAVSRLDPGDGVRVAVLGPGRLGLLTIAALAAWRRTRRRAFEIEAIGRGPERLALAAQLGADRTTTCDARTQPTGARAEIVIDTTGSPEGLALACALASREVHLKSTHGQAVAGLAHWTEAVVDELSIAGLASPGREGADVPSLTERLAGLEAICRRDALCVGWLGETGPPPRANGPRVEWLRAPDAPALLTEVEARFARDAQQTLPRVDAVVIDRAADIDAAIRPDAAREISCVRPTGEVWVRGPTAGHDAAPIEAALARGLRISTSRCGDFRAAMALLVEDTELLHLGDRMVSHRFAATDLTRAFACARSSEGLKVLVDHPDRGGPRADVSGTP